MSKRATSWWEKEFRFENNSRPATNLWKYIPERLKSAVDECSTDSDGYWVYLENGYVAYDGGEDCWVIHEYTITDLKAAIKTIRKA